MPYALVCHAAAHPGVPSQIGITVSPTDINIIGYQSRDIKTLSETGANLLLYTYRTGVERIASDFELYKYDWVTETEPS